MKLTVDRYIPFLEGVFEPYAEVVYKDGKDICADDASDSDALIIRTRTKCGAPLLAGSRVSMIATATIGTDHIDLPWCADNGIEVANAQGCNAGGVMQYVFTALYALAQKKGLSLDGKTLGIIGVGHVGSKVEAMARELGFKLLLCDPPRAAAEGPDGFCELDDLLAQADIVTMHTYLDSTTRCMADRSFFSKMKDGAIFINASRGEVVVDKALIEAAPKFSGIIIDTWNGEPEIDRELMGLADIATTHIAGYSYQGKQNGTAMAVQAVARHFGIEPLMNFRPVTESKEKEVALIDFSAMNQSQIANILQENYPIFGDDRDFRSAPERFEQLRSEYDYRREVDFIPHR